ncbi:serine-type D-Ala-D-Ala carboxypeptidase [Candidatus Palibaumannia cicadellinicola]|uniref:D-alanyl-D-alanine carboxypeptidase n=1 Tax=Candidatus Palibaumannia cicadellinicola TaxID=186490 RepID=A0A088N2J8_9GAMM|nr:serine-type D-Ala-D-Ala carboxypeptidase [Candidatus Baumannia cicadellinicola]AIN47561.1 D-alanyl-D-alanine carboxypeptidase [Candidatus Baumannia cicadellinicola]
MFVSKLIRCWTSVLILSAQAVAVENYTAYLPEGVNLALMVQKVGAPQPIIDYHSQQLALPASTIKLLTALAALLQLGPTYRFHTSFEAVLPAVEGVLHSDLIAHFGGDPTFSRQRLHTMVTTLRKQRIRQITGNLIIDTSVFASYDKAPGWPWNNLTRCFSSPPGAAIIDRNCFSLSLYSGQTVGEIAFIHLSSYYPIHMFSQVRTLARRSRDYCELDIISGELNRFTLTGCITQRSEPLSLTFAVQDGASYVGAIIKEALKQADIKLNGTIIRQNYPTTVTSRQVLAESTSAPLHDLLHVMLKTSDNMIADTIFRTIGHERFKVPGTWRAGSDAVRQILHEYANINLGNTIQVDGSGLSRYDLISPATMMRVLQYIGQHDQVLNFISMLPLAGYDGTLMFRTGLHKAGLDGKLSAKTGSLQGVYNLAGFMTVSSGQRIAFVQYLSGYTVLHSPEDSYAYKIPLVRFEYWLYKTIYLHN